MAKGMVAKVLGMAAREPVGFRGSLRKVGPEI